jgi:hypothetical protein
MPLAPRRDQVSRRGSSVNQPIRCRLTPLHAWLSSLLRTASQRSTTVMIKKVAGGYKVLSEKGKNLGGPYKTKKEAETRLKQVEYFKHNKG